MSPTAPAPMFGVTGAEYDQVFVAIKTAAYAGADAFSPELISDGNIGCLDAPNCLPAGSVLWFESQSTPNFACASPRMFWRA